MHLTKINNAVMPYIKLKIKGFQLLTDQWENLMRPYQQDLTVRKRADAVVTFGWFVCLAVSMVTTSKPAGLEQTQL